MEPKSGFFPSVWIRNNSKVASFLLCFFIATGIWIVNALNKTQHSTIEITLRYDHTWLRAWNSGNQPRKVSFQVSGRGFDLLQFFFTRSLKVLEINEDRLFTGDKQVKTVELLQPLLAEYSTRLTVNNVNPEWIPLPSRKPFFKRVAVRPRYEITLAASYMIPGPAVCVPDSIWLSSSEPFSDTLKTVYTNKISRVNSDRPVFASSIIDLSGLPKVIPDHKEVWSYIPVEEATECTVTVPLILDSEIVNANDIQLVPASIEVSCRVPLSRFDQTTAAKFKAVVLIDNYRQKKAAVEIKVFPFWADNIRYKPASIDYFVKNAK